MRSGRYQDEEWEERYEFTGTKLQDFPLPADLPPRPRPRAGPSRPAPCRRTSHGGCERDYPRPAKSLDARPPPARRHPRQQMIALQEELDWTVYRSYGLLTETEAKALIARRQCRSPWRSESGRSRSSWPASRRRGRTETAWFERHGSTPITELPAHWSREYRASSRPASTPSRAAATSRSSSGRSASGAGPPSRGRRRKRAALRTWLARSLRGARSCGPALRDGRGAAAHADRQPARRSALCTTRTSVAVAQLYAADHLGKRDLTLARCWSRSSPTSTCRYLAALRYKDSGPGEARGVGAAPGSCSARRTAPGTDLDIAVPPKYKPADFRARSATGASAASSTCPRSGSSPTRARAPTPTPRCCSAGPAGTTRTRPRRWSTSSTTARPSQAGTTTRVTPLLAGLAEVLPWVHQWHGEYDDDWGGIPAEEYQAYLDEQRTQRGMTDRHPARVASRPGGPRPQTEGNGVTETYLRDVLDAAGGRARRGLQGRAGWRLHRGSHGAAGTRVCGHRPAAPRSSRSVVGDPRRAARRHLTRRLPARIVRLRQEPLPHRAARCPERRRPRRAPSPGCSR